MMLPSHQSPATDACGPLPSPAGLQVAEQLQQLADSGWVPQVGASEGWWMESYLLRLGLFCLLTRATWLPPHAASPAQAASSLLPPRAAPRLLPAGGGVQQRAAHASDA